MWKELYSWKVADAIREGREVYALDLRGREPELIPGCAILVQGFFRLLDDEKHVMWFEKEETNGNND